MPHLSEIEQLMLAAANIAALEDQPESFDEHFVFQTTLHQAYYATQLYTFAEGARLYGNYTVYSDAFYLHIRSLLFAQLALLADNQALSPATIQSKQQELEDLVAQDLEQPEDIADRAYRAIYISAEILLLDLSLKYFNGWIDNTTFISTICDLKLIFKPAHRLLTQGDLNAVVKSAINQNQEWLIERIFSTGVKSHATSEMYAILDMLDGYTRLFNDIEVTEHADSASYIASVLRANLLEDDPEANNASYDTSIPPVNKEDVISRVRSAPPILTTTTNHMQNADELHTTSSSEVSKAEAVALQNNYDQLLASAKEFNSDEFTRVQQLCSESQILSCLNALCDIGKPTINKKKAKPKIFQDAYHKACLDHRAKIIRFIDELTLPWHILRDLCLGLCETKEHRQLVLDLVYLTAKRFPTSLEETDDSIKLSKLSALLEESLVINSNLEAYERTHRLIDVAASMHYVETFNALNSDSVDDESIGKVIDELNNKLEQKYRIHIYKAMFQVSTEDQATLFYLVLTKHINNSQLVKYFAGKWIDFILYMQNKALDPAEYTNVKDENSSFAAPRIATINDLFLVADLVIFKQNSDLGAMFKHNAYNEICKRLPLIKHPKWSKLVTEAYSDSKSPMSDEQLATLQELAIITKKLAINPNMTLAVRGGINNMLTDIVMSRSVSFIRAALSVLTLDISIIFLFYATEAPWIDADLMITIFKAYQKAKPTTDFKECTIKLNEVTHSILTYCLLKGPDIQKLAELVRFGIEPLTRFGDLAPHFQNFNLPQILLFHSVMRFPKSYDKWHHDLQLILGAYKFLEVQFPGHKHDINTYLFANLCAVQIKHSTQEALNLVEMIISLEINEDASAADKAEFELRIESMFDSVLICDPSRYSFRPIKLVPSDAQLLDASKSQDTSHEVEVLKCCRALHVALSTGKIEIAKKVAAISELYPDNIQNILDITYQGKTLPELAHAQGVELSSLSPKFGSQQSAYGGPKLTRP